jgi:hypothetical protein
MAIRVRDEIAGPILHRDQNLPNAEKFSFAKKIAQN